MHTIIIIIFINVCTCRIINILTCDISKFFFTATTSSPPPPPLGIQGLCSVVVWYGPENITCENTIRRYEIIFYDSMSNVTRYVEANRTFYILTDEDRLSGEETYVQVS